MLLTREVGCWIGCVCPQGQPYDLSCSNVDSRPLSWSARALVSILGLFAFSAVIPFLMGVLVVGVVGFGLGTWLIGKGGEVGVALGRWY